MSLLIGIKQADFIRYISVEDIPEFDRITGTLKTFYKTSERAEALIGLGNLIRLGKSPYKKNKGDAGALNCEAKIRDKKLSPGKHGSSTAKNEKEFVKQLERNPRGINCCFLYENNEWFILVGGHKENIKTVDESVLKKDRLMEGLKVYVYDHGNQYSRLTEKSFYSWNEVQQSANEEQTPHYIFRGERYLTAITPNPKKEPENVVSDNRK